jgi:hypothetical protein
MSRLASLCSAIQHLAQTHSPPRERDADRPASFAEIVAASAFLDFGGMPSGDWLHAWEASIERDRRPEDEKLAAAADARQQPENKRIGESFEKEIIVFGPHRPEDAAYDFIGRAAFPFRNRDGAPMLLIDKLNGPSAMRLDIEFRALDLAMCVAAFGFIAGMLALAHPALPTSDTANAAATQAAAAVIASTPTGTPLTRLGPR